MKKKVLLLTALASITLASVATVAAVGKSEFRDVKATDYSIVLDSNSTFSKEYDTEYYMWDISLSGKTGSGNYDFSTVGDGESYLYVDDHYGNFTNPTGYIFKLTDSSGYCGSYINFRFNIMSPASNVSIYAVVSYNDGALIDDPIDTFDIDGGVGANFFWMPEYGEPGSVAVQKFVINYSC